MLIGASIITYLAYCFYTGYKRGIIRQVAPVISWIFSFLIQRPLVAVLRTTEYWNMVYEIIYNYILTNLAEMPQHSLITTQIGRFSYRMTSTFFWFLSYLCIRLVLRLIFQGLFTIERIPFIGTVTKAAGGFVCTGIGAVKVVIIFFVVFVLSAFQIPAAVSIIELVTGDALIQYLLQMFSL